MAPGFCGARFPGMLDGCCGLLGGFSDRHSLRFVAVSEQQAAIFHGERGMVLGSDSFSCAP